MKRRVRGLGIAGLAVLMGLAAAPAGAGSLHRFSGTVVRVTDEAVVLKEGGRTLEFSKAAGYGPELRAVRPGDRLTLEYVLEVKGVRAHETPSQQPGQASPSEAPSDGETRRIILDDRAFYDARSDRPEALASRTYC